MWGDSGSVYKIGYQNETFNTTQCVFFLTQKVVIYDTFEVNFMVYSITMYNMWCLLCIYLSMK